MMQGCAILNAKTTILVLLLYATETVLKGLRTLVCSVKSPQHMDEEQVMKVKEIV